VYNSPSELLGYSQNNFTVINTNTNEFVSGMYNTTAGTTFDLSHQMLIVKSIGTISNLEDCFTLSYDYTLNFFALCHNKGVSIIIVHHSSITYRHHPSAQWTFNSVDITTTGSSVSATLTPIVTPPNPLVSSQSDYANICFAFLLIMSGLERIFSWYAGC